MPGQRQETGAGRPSSTSTWVRLNAGGNANNGTTLSAADFSGSAGADVAVIGIITMTVGDYANFGATNLAAVF